MHSVQWPQKVLCQVHQPWCTKYYLHCPFWPPPGKKSKKNRRKNGNILTWKTLKPPPPATKKPFHHLLPSQWSFVRHHGRPSRCGCSNSWWQLWQKTSENPPNPIMISAMNGFFWWSFPAKNWFFCLDASQLSKKKSKQRFVAPNWSWRFGSRDGSFPNAKCGGLAGGTWRRAFQWQTLFGVRKRLWFQWFEDHKSQIQTYGHFCDLGHRGWAPRPPLLQNPIHLRWLLNWNCFRPKICRKTTTEKADPEF